MQPLWVTLMFTKYSLTPQVVRKSSTNGTTDKKKPFTYGTELRLGRKGAKGSLCAKSKEAVQNAKVQIILYSVLILLPYKRLIFDRKLGLKTVPYY